MLLTTSWATPLACGIRIGSIAARRLALSVLTVPSLNTVTIWTLWAWPGDPRTTMLSRKSAKTWYYLEQRQAIGFDAFLTNGTCSQCYTQNETTGVLFHIGTDGDGNSSELIDMTPATASSGYYDPSLVVGQTFQ